MKCFENNVPIKSYQPVCKLSLTSIKRFSRYHDRPHWHMLSLHLQVRGYPTRTARSRSWSSGTPPRHGRYRWDVGVQYNVCLGVCVLVQAGDFLPWDCEAAQGEHVQVSTTHCEYAPAIYKLGQTPRINVRAIVRNLKFGNIRTMEIASGVGPGSVQNVGDVLFEW